MDSWLRHAKAVLSDLEARDFCKYIDSTPSPFHLVSASAARLDAAGFIRLSEGDNWADKIKPGTKAYYDRNGSTLVAFAVGEKYTAGGSFKAVGAHTDSPVLKVKPVSAKKAHGYLQVGVECYGGGLWHTWFDRELTVAGRVIVDCGGGKFACRNVHVKRPILRIPNLCIHLQSAEERKSFTVNKENHLAPILSIQKAAEAMLNDVSGSVEGCDPRHPPLLLRVVAEELGIAARDIKDLELSLCDTQPAQIWGVGSEFLSSPRLDNQVHCFTSTDALIEHARMSLAGDCGVSVIALFDHEEVGSRSAQGAGSPIFRDAIIRINEALTSEGVGSSSETFKMALSRSLLLSADVAHAIHPNYGHKHEGNHQPLLNGGTVLKTNSSTRYATDGISGFFFRELARRSSQKIQEFVVRQDCPCGTTIGPIIAANTGLRAVDIGVPSLSMHSIRETIGVADITNNRIILRTFFREYDALKSMFTS
eukprot:m.448277 g.448277  ORF g.448277 m.448277 type:complete len:479 (+) comp19637_c0_seq1:1245-2681(+)